MNNSIASQSTCTVVIAFSNYSFNNSIRILSLYRSSFPSLIISPETKSLFFERIRGFIVRRRMKKKTISHSIVEKTENFKGYYASPSSSQRKKWKRNESVILSQRWSSSRAKIRRGIISRARRGKKEVKIGIRVSLNWNGIEGAMFLQRGGVSVKLRSSLPRDEILIYISIPVRLWLIKERGAYPKKAITSSLNTAVSPRVIAPPSTGEGIPPIPFLRHEK